MSLFEWKEKVINKFNEMVVDCNSKEELDKIKIQFQKYMEINKYMDDENIYDKIYNAWKNKEINWAILPLGSNVLRIHLSNQAIMLKNSSKAIITRIYIDIKK